MDFLRLSQHPDGGFGGGPGLLAHLAPTYAAVATLVNLNREGVFEDDEPLRLIDRCVSACVRPPPLCRCPC